MWTEKRILTIFKMWCQFKGENEHSEINSTCPNLESLRYARCFVQRE